MTIQNRTVTITGVFAEDANTTIPQAPVAGQSYRDTALTQTEVKAGWPYKEIVDSAKFNQYLYEVAFINKLFETYGFLPWSANTNYEKYSCCIGTDGKIYQAKQNTGPSSTAKDPVTDNNHTYWNVGFARVPDNNTWTGTNAFGTITVPNRSAGDSTTNAANTAFVTTAVNAVNNNVLHKSGNESASGIKKFSSSPEIPTPSTSDNSTKAANTAYVQANLAGAVSSIKTANLTTNRALVSDGSGKVAVATTTSTELGYVHGVTSAIQTQLNGKVDLTNAQNINGTKTFLQDIIIKNTGPDLWLDDTNYTKGERPTSNQDKSIRFRDSANAVIGIILHRVEAPSNESVPLQSYIRIQNYKPVEGSSAASYLAIDYKSNGEYYMNFSVLSGDSGDNNLSLTKSTASTSDTTVPCMGWVNSRLINVLTNSGAGLATYSKGQNGYYKFNNGLLIQWGLVQTNDRTATITFLQPFSSANSYSLCIDQLRISNATDFNKYCIWRAPKSTTGANLYIRDKDGHNFYWMAIGY